MSCQERQGEGQDKGGMGALGLKSFHTAGVHLCSDAEVLMERGAKGLGERCQQPLPSLKPLEHEASHWLQAQAHAVQETTAAPALPGAAVPSVLSSVFHLQHLRPISFAYSYPQRRLHG